MPTNIEALIHSPADLAVEYVQWAEHAQKYPGITWGVSGIDREVIPMRPGDMVSLISRPGHAKTTMLAYLARTEAKRIQERGAARKEAVVYVTYESPAETLEAMFQADGQVSATDIAWGRADLDIVKRQSVKRANVPLWVIGHGIGRMGQKIPRMYPKIVLEAIEAMESTYDVRPTLLLFDYVQIVPVEKAGDRVAQVTDVPFRIKELALRIGVPAVCGVQASRRVDDYDVKIPRESDAQWASAIEQTSDKIFGLWRPAKTEAPGSIIELEDGKQYPVNDELFILRKLKERYNRACFTWALHFQMEYLKLAELEMRETPIY